MFLCACLNNDLTFEAVEERVLLFWHHQDPRHSPPGKDKFFHCVLVYTICELQCYASGQFLHGVESGQFSRNSGCASNSMKNNKNKKIKQFA